MPTTTKNFSASNLSRVVVVVTVVDDDVTVVTGNTITLPTPIKNHYIFDKWVLSTDETVEFTESTNLISIDALSEDFK